MRKTILFLLSLNIFLCEAQNKNKLDSLQRILDNSTTDTGKVNALNELSWEYRKNDPSKALEFSDQALKIISHVDYPKGSANTFSNRGAIFHLRAEYDSALFYYTKALIIRKEINDLKGESNSLTNIGIIYKNLGDYSRALQYYFKALKIKENLNDQRGIAIANNNISNIYIEQQNYLLALKHLQEAVDVFEKLKDSASLSICYNNLGQIYHNQKSISQAETFYQKSLDIAKSINDRREISAVYNNIGLINMDKGKYREALDYFFKTADLRKQSQDNSGIANVYSNIGTAYEKLNDFENAIKYFNESITLAKDIRDMEWLQNAYNGLYLTYKKRGDLKEALTNHELYLLYRDSLFNENSSQQIARMQTQFETEKKQKEIEVLTKEKEIQGLEFTKQEAELRNEKLLRNSFIGGFLFILILAFLIYNRYQIKNKSNALLARQKQEIQHQKEIVEEQNKDIKDSIRYAKRIQEAILPTTLFKNIFTERGFVLYKPKDIVSGDFYWVEQADGKTLFAAVDCTGHGVPGAFMSIVGYNLLTQSVNERKISEPGAILEQASYGMTDTLRQTQSESTIRDGMDIALCALNEKNNTLEYAGAYNPLWLVRNGELIELKGEKRPVGLFVGEKVQSFKTQRLQLQKGDLVYVFTDGYADQFGGPNGKKFKYKQFQELLISIHADPMHQQKEILEKAFEDWKGDLDQVDDVLVIGVRV